MKHSIALMLALEVLGASGEAMAKAPIREISVARTRVTLADVLPRVAPELAGIDLGPAPAPGGSRVLTRAELQRAVDEVRSKVAVTLPAAVRVVRKMARFTTAELDQLTRRAIDGSGLTRGVSITAVHPSGPVEVPAGWDTVRASLPQRAHRAGVSRATALLTFSAGPDTLANITVPVEISLTPEAAAWDLSKGSMVKVVVRRGSIEIEAPAIAAADADVGAVLPVMLRSSGRILRVRLIDREHGELVEGG